MFREVLSDIFQAFKLTAFNVSPREYRGLVLKLLYFFHFGILLALLTTLLNEMCPLEFAVHFFQMQMSPSIRAILKLVYLTI